MKSILLIPVAFSALILLSCQACQSDSSRRSDQSERAAREAAASLIAAQPMSDMQLQSRILEIRSNEYKLREAGYDEAADTYVAVFESTLRAGSDSLARVVFGD